MQIFLLLYRPDWLYNVYSAVLWLCVFGSVVVVCIRLCFVCLAVLCLFSCGFLQLCCVYSAVLCMLDVFLSVF